MTLKNVRHQRPVGQGFFQTAELIEDGDLRLRYVYDCGSMHKYATQRDACIDTFVNAVGVGSLIDVLFLSHVHYDHVSGVKRLLATSTGLKVDTIVLPLINVADRLIAYARATAEERAAARDDFYRDFVVSPADALAVFEPRSILFVEHGEGGAPGSGGPDEGGPYTGPEDRRGLKARQTEFGPSWLLIGSGSIRTGDPRTQMIDGGQPSQFTAVIEDTLALATSSPTTGGEWLLAPFVDPVVASKRSSFLAALAAARKLSVPALKTWLADPAHVEDLVLNGISDLAAAYTAIEPDFNVTSLCLYSGPLPSKQTFPQSFKIGFGRFHSHQFDSPRIAWMGTGDAALKAKSRSKAFVKHYGRLLNEVVTLTLPHHGSDHNHDPAVLTAVDPVFFVAAADQFSNWRHPGSRVVQSVASRGRFVSVVTSDPQSGVQEWARIG